MSDDAPDFNQLVGPYLLRVPEPMRPAVLAALERVAAQRYREWAAGSPEQAEALGACAAREEEIAGMAEQLFPPDDEARKRIHELLPEARSAYASVFEGRSLRDQWRIQAVAERTGAAAWRALAGSAEEASTRDALLRCAELEEASARVLDDLAETH